MTIKCSIKDCKEEADFPLGISCYLCSKHFTEIVYSTRLKDLLKLEKTIKGCNVLFKSGSGLIICREKRLDGNQFLCMRCIKEKEVVNK